MDELNRLAAQQDVFRALALAAKSRQAAYNESRETYRQAIQNGDLSTDSRSEALILSALFLSMAKAARVEAEAMLAEYDRARALASEREGEKA